MMSLLKIRCTFVCRLDERRCRTQPGPYFINLFSPDRHVLSFPDNLLCDVAASNAYPDSFGFRSLQGFQKVARNILHQQRNTPPPALRCVHLDEITDLIQKRFRNHCHPRSHKLVELRPPPWVLLQCPAKLIKTACRRKPPQVLPSVAVQFIAHRIPL